jgi:pimeloyl-ACP methyl ester carboxylesterase
MAKKTDKNPGDYIFPLNMNGLQGRMLHLPAKKAGSRELLVIYGHHALLERWWGLVENFNDFGAVTMPDLPGFGGMDSFYKIKTKPEIDAFADYLATFIKLRYKRKKITIVGVSYGFVIATRMLQRYPDLVKQVDLLICAVGFAHEDDFVFSRTRMALYRTSSKVVSTRIVAPIFRALFLNPLVLRVAYGQTRNAKPKFAEAENDPEKLRVMMDLEIKLWHDNDIRTHMFTTNKFLHLDNCRQQIKLPVWHIYSSNDHYFNNSLVEQHFRVIFSDYHGVQINMKTHAPSIMADKKASRVLIPKELRKLLSKKSVK